MSIIPDFADFIYTRPYIFEIQYQITRPRCLGAILYFHVTSLPSYYYYIILIIIIILLLNYYYHVGKCRKLALCYFIQINLILFCLTTIWKCGNFKQKVTWLKPENSRTLLRLVDDLLISNSLVIHKIKTKEIDTETEFGYVMKHLHSDSLKHGASA